MGQTTASLELYSTRKIKKVLNTSIKELSTSGEYDYLPTPNIKVLYPKGGERFYIDTPIEIQWSNDAIEVAPQVTIGYDINLDNKLHGIAAFVPSGDPRTEIGSYVWSPSKSLSNPDATERIQPSDNYRIHVHTVAYGEAEPITATMNKVFTITTRSLELKQMSGEVLSNKGSYVAIQWESDGAGDYVGIRLVDKTPRGTSPFEPKSFTSIISPPLSTVSSGSSASGGISRDDNRIPEIEKPPTEIDIDEETRLVGPPNNRRPIPLSEFMSNSEEIEGEGISRDDNRIPEVGKPSTEIEEDVYREPILYIIEEKYYAGNNKTYVWHTDNIPPWVFTASIAIYDPERPATLIDFSQPFDVTKNYVKISSTSGIKSIGQTDENGTIITYETPGFDGTSYLVDAINSLKSVSTINNIPHYDRSSWYGLYMLLDAGVKEVAKNMYKLYTMISSLGNIKEVTKPGFPVAGENFVKVGEKISVNWNSRDIPSVSFYFMKGNQKIFVNSVTISDKEQYEISQEKDHMIYTGTMDIPIHDSFYSKEYVPYKIRIEMEDDTSVFDETMPFKIISGSI